MVFKFISKKDLFLDERFAKGITKNSKRERRTSFKTITDIHVIKIEKFNKKGELLSTLYNINLPGFPMEIFKINLNKRGVERSGFSNEDIEHSLNDLVKENIFKVMEYNGQHRYVMVDKGLHLFMKKLLLLLNYILYKMDLVWIFLHRPSREDIKWLELFIGIEDTKEKINELKEYRKRYRKNKKQSIEAKKEITTLRKR